MRLRARPGYLTGVVHNAMQTAGLLSQRDTVCLCTGMHFIELIQEKKKLSFSAIGTECPVAPIGRPAGQEYQSRIRRKLTAPSMGSMRRWKLHQH